MKDISSDKEALALALKKNDPIATSLLEGTLNGKYAKEALCFMFELLKKDVTPQSIEFAHKQIGKACMAVCDKYPLTWKIYENYTSDGVSRVYRMIKHKVIIMPNGEYEIWDLFPEKMVFKKSHE